MAEHLKAGGESVVIYLLNVLNTFVELKRGVVVVEGSTAGGQLLGSDVVIDRG